VRPLSPLLPPSFYRLTLPQSRQDGTPFLNLLLIAPLYDDKNTIRYFLGAQIDINGLLEGGGRGLDSFAALLARDNASSLQSTDRRTLPTPKSALATLSGLLNAQERDAIHYQYDGRLPRGTGDGTPRGKNTDPSSTPTTWSSGRRMIGMSDHHNGNDGSDASLWPSKHLGPNGRLPGVFQNVRYHPVVLTILTNVTLTRPPTKNSTSSSAPHPPSA